MDPTVGIGDVLHLMDFVKKFFRNWFYLEEINWLYILYNGATLLTIYNKCWRWKKKNVLTKKKYFDGYLLYIPKVNYRRRGIFFFLNAVLRNIYPLVLSHHYFRQLKSSKTTANYYVHHSLLSKILHVLLRN